MKRKCKELMKMVKKQAYKVVDEWEGSEEQLRARIF